jgi:hypothetical protein
MPTIPFQKKHFKPAKYDSVEWHKLIHTKPKNLIGSNSKLSKSNIYQWSIPAFRAVLTEGIINTCPKEGTCANACYAQQGGFIFSRTLVKHHQNLNFYVKHKKEWKDKIIEEITNINGLKAFRIHDSGDFFNWGYFLDWIDIIESLPNIQFYAYTKMVRMIKGHTLPNNFTVIFSYGGLEDKYIDPLVDRHSRVFSSKQSLLEHGYSDTSETDCNATNPAIKNIGLVYHGVKHYTGAFLVS